MLAEKLGSSARYVQSVEAGSENLTIETMAKIAAVLKADLQVQLSTRTTALKQGSSH